MRQFLTIVSLVLGLAASVIAQPATTTPFAFDSSLVKDLSSFKWKMKMMPVGEGVRQGLHQLYPEDIETLVWNMAQVPGDVYTDLWRVGAIDDPYFGRNTAKAQWVQHYEWWYTLQFNVTEPLDGRMARIRFDGVDYACDVWLNGEKLGSNEGAFAPFEFDVSKVLRIGKSRGDSSNILIVRLAPPPQVNALVAGKKTPWFGDYWRDITPFGIYRPVKLYTTGKVYLADAFANTKINKDGSADITFEVEIENKNKDTSDVEMSISFQGKNFSSSPIKAELKDKAKVGRSLLKKTVHVEKPELWWPWDMGKPNLYTANIWISSNGKKQDSKTFDFGIREVTTAWNPGFSSDEVSFPRTTLINGKVHFIRSGCWGGPPNIFVGRTNSTLYKRIIEQVKDANFNNIRIFGWHNPEIPEFYQLCDELGLTVWQDIVPLGTGNIPTDKKSTDEIISTAVQVLKERRNHPSLIMMEGGEELFLRTRDVKFARNFLENLGRELQKCNNIPYVPDSPLTCENSRKAGYKPKEAVHALAYFYNMGFALMEDWYRKLDYPIVPEFAISSVPSVNSLKKFIPKDEMWPPSLSWGHHWADLDRLKMQNFDTFGSKMDGSLEEFVNATQISQGVIFKNGIEFFRRQKPKLSGIAICHIITYWPDMKWAVIDNYGEPKKSLDYVRKAYQPILVCFDFEKRRWHNSEPLKGSIWIVNDLYETYKDCSINMSVCDADGNVISKKTFPAPIVRENSSEKIVDIDIDALKNLKDRFIVKLSLSDSNGKALSENDYFFLIGDQKEATAEFRKMRAEVIRKDSEYTYGNYYKFFPEKMYDGAKKEENSK